MDSTLIDNDIHGTLNYTFALIKHFNISEATIGGNTYQHNKVNQWTSNVVEQCLNQLTKLSKPFKYIVNCVIMQKNGAGLKEI